MAFLTQVTVHPLGYDKVVNYHNKDKYSEEWYHKHSQKQMIESKENNALIKRKYCIDRL